MRDSVAPLFVKRPELLLRLPRDRSAVIEAHAGTGKTYTIEHLVIDLLINEADPLPIEQLLVVTYTDKAAAELRERVRKMIESILRQASSQLAKQEEPIIEAAASQEFWRIGEPERRRLEQAIFSFDLASISTIHSFCQRILRESAFWSARLFSLELGNTGDIFSEVFYECMRRDFLQYPRGRELVEQWVQERTVAQLETLLRNAWQKLVGDEAWMVAGDLGDECTICDQVIKEFLPSLQSKVTAAKRARGRADFNDLLALVDATLSDPVHGEIFVRSLRDRYRVALIDEFQDTDVVQWRIFRKIFFAEANNQKCRCYLVGDPKQAIYGFRGADVNTYLAAAREVTATSCEPIRLEKNFRSTGAMIAAYNLILDQQAAEPFFTSADIRYDYPVECGRTTLKLANGLGEEMNPVTLLCVKPPLDEDSLCADDLREGLLTLITNEIKDILGQDPRKQQWIIDTATGERTRVCAKDIFILARGASEIASLAQHLREAEIPFSLYKEEGLFASDEAKDICDLLMAIACPDDESLLLKACLTPFFDISLNDLYERNGAANACAHAVEAVKRWRAKADERRMIDLFQLLLAETRIIEREIFVAIGERSLTNYLHIFEILVTWCEQSPTDIAGLAEQLYERIYSDIGPSREEDLQRLETDKEAVQLMTMHKSKGLEAGVVFLFGGFTSPSVNSLWVDPVTINGSKVLVAGSPPDNLKDLLGKAKAEEQQRLLYVALTRARGKLFLPFIDWNPAASKGKGDWHLSSRSFRGLYRQINERLLALRNETNKDENGIYSKLFNTVVMYLEQASSSNDISEKASVQKPAESVQVAINLQLPAQPSVELARAKAAPLMVESYSSLRHGHQRILPDEMLDLPAQAVAREKVPQGAAFGLLMHSILQKVDLVGIRAEAVSSLEEWMLHPINRELVQHEMAIFGVAEEYFNYCCGLAWNALRTPVVEGELALSAGVAAAPQSGRELEFLFPHKRGFIKGYVDLVLASGGKAWFLDWKTDVLPDYSAATLGRVVRDRYEIQFLLYSLGLTKMLKIASEEEYNHLFGGWIYAFVRGMNVDNNGSGVHVARTEWSILHSFAKRLGVELG